MKTKILKISAITLGIFMYSVSSVSIDAVNGVKNEEIKLSENEEQISNNYDLELDNILNKLSKQKKQEQYSL